MWTAKTFCNMVWDEHGDYLTEEEAREVAIREGQKRADAITGFHRYSLNKDAYRGVRVFAYVQSEKQRNLPVLDKKGRLNIRSTQVAVFVDGRLTVG